MKKNYLEYHFMASYIMVYLVIWTGYRYRMAEIGNGYLIALAALAAVWLVVLLITKTSIKLPPWPWNYLAAALATIVITINSKYLAVSIYELILWFTAAFIFILVINIAYYGGKKYITTAALVTGLLFSLLKLSQAIQLLLLRTSECKQIIELPNKSAALLNLIMILALGVMIYEPGRRKIWPGIVAGLSALAVLATGSRGGLLAAVASIIVILAVSEYLGLTRLRKNKALAAGALAGVILLPLAAVYLLRPVGCSGVWDTNISTRPDLWKAALQIFIDNPVYGAGPGSFQFVAGPLFDYHVTTIHAHSIYFNTAAERGLLGILAAGTLAITVIIDLVKNRTDIRYISIGLAALTALAVHGLVDVPLVEPMAVRYLLIVIGLAISPGQKE